MKVEHLLKSFALFGNFHRRLAGEQGQDAHRFENAQHLVIGAELLSMCENAIIRGLHLFRDKPGERVEQSRLSHHGNCIGRLQFRVHGRNTCFARSNSEKSLRR